MEMRWHKYYALLIIDLISQWWALAFELIDGARPNGEKEDNTVSNSMTTIPIQVNLPILQDNLMKNSMWLSVNYKKCCIEKLVR